MKKAIIIFAAAALVLTLTPVTAFAHGHSGRGTSSTYSSCNVENCDTSSEHKHNGITYSGHTTGDGHRSRNTNGGCRRGQH